MENKTWHQHPPYSTEEVTKEESILLDYQNIGEWFTATCNKHSSSPALTAFGVTYSYKKWWEESEALAKFFQSQWNVQKGDRIAIQMPNVHQIAVAVMATHLAQATAVLINPLYTASELDHLLSDSKPKGLLVLDLFAHEFQEIQSKHKNIPLVITKISDIIPPPKKFLVDIVLGLKGKKAKKDLSVEHHKWNYALSKGRAKTLVDHHAGHSDVAFLQYTGGTTGVSKAAILSQKNILTNMRQAELWINSFPEHKSFKNDVLALPVYHIFCLTVQLFCLSNYGMSHHLVINPRDLKSLLKIIEKGKINLFCGVNTLFASILNYPKVKKEMLKDCYYCVAGGMALKPRVAEAWEEFFGHPILQGYGLTEASPVVSVNHPNSNNPNTIGPPLPGTNVKIHQETQEEKDKNIGELWIQGDQVMRGYWNQEKETKDCITEDGWLKTGDMATIDEKGRMKILDRKKELIIVSGFNVYPSQIESVITQHDKVADCAVIGVPCDLSGEKIKAFIIPKDPKEDCDNLKKELREHAKQSLTSYKIPKLWQISDDLPKTPVGKILKRELK